MKPVEFEGQNNVYHKPESMSEEECGSLPVNQTKDIIVCCWELDENDIKDILKTKRIWLGIITSVQPPVFLTTGEPYQVSVTKMENQN